MTFLRILKVISDISAAVEFLISSDL